MRPTGCSTWPPGTSPRGSPRSHGRSTIARSGSAWTPTATCSYGTATSYGRTSGATARSRDTPPPASASPWKPCHGSATLFLAINPSVLRIANRLSTARNAWLEPNDPHAPLLVLGLTGRSGQKDVDWHTRLILDVWTRLRGEQPLIPATADLSGRPDDSGP